MFRSPYRPAFPDCFFTSSIACCQGGFSHTDPIPNLWLKHLIYKAVEKNKTFPDRCAVFHFIGPLIISHKSLNAPEIYSIVGDRNFGWYTSAHPEYFESETRGYELFGWSATFTMSQFNRQTSVVVLKEIAW